jgi:hypothetical protein
MQLLIVLVSILTEYCAIGTVMEGFKFAPLGGAATPIAAATAACKPIPRFFSNLFPFSIFQIQASGA